MQEEFFKERLISRRSVLRYAAGSVAMAAMPGAVFGQCTIADLGSYTLTSDVTVLKTGAANQAALDTPEGIVLVDSGPTEACDMLQSSLSRINSRGVHTLFNTHWHPDQVGGNALFKDQGARIVAHEKTLQRLSTRYYLPHAQRYHEPMPAKAWPTDIFHDQGSMTVGNADIEYGWLVQPHTDGDIYVYFRNANVLVAGDAVSPERDPELDWYGGGWLGGRVNTQDMLLDITNADTRIVPAYGPVMSRAELQAERDMTQEIYNRVLDLIRDGCSASCMQQEGALDGLPREFADPHKFLYAAYKGMWAHHYNLAPNIL